MCDRKEVGADGCVRLEAWEDRRGESHGDPSFCDVPGAGLGTQGACKGVCPALLRHENPCPLRAHVVVGRGGQVEQ